MTNVIGREAFKAADIAEHRARKLALVDARRELERTKDDAETALTAALVEEHEVGGTTARIAIADAEDMAFKAATFCVQMEVLFTGLHKAGLADAPTPADFAALAELLADRFSNDDLARVFLAAFALEGN